MRDWRSTIKGTKDLWEIAQRPSTIALFDSQSATLGIRDTLNMEFVKMVQNFHRDKKLSNKDVAGLCGVLEADFGEHLFNPFLRLKSFDGHRDTPVEILHVILLGVGKYLLHHQMKNCSASEKDSIRGRWTSFNTSGLNIPPIQPKTMIHHFLSLNGKEFRTVLQAAPFIFFECNLTEEERATWKSLSSLAPYIFQTEITNMDTYLNELAIHIQRFLQAIVQMSAQWCNKPKFHMLIHLCDSIDRFGPACLFATENFERFNGHTRHQSVHSNHLSPGRDIANYFNDGGLMRSVTAGSYLYDDELQTYIRSSINVRRLFQTNLLLQRALGYNSSWNKEREIGIGKKQNVQPSSPEELVPKAIRDAFAAKDWKVIKSITLKSEQSVTSDCFVSVNSPATSRTIGRVVHVWGVGGCALRQVKVEVHKCVLGGISEFYGMREIQERTSLLLINPEDIEAVLNVQHDCHKSRCKVQRTRPVMIEREVSKSLDFAVAHASTNDFIINSAAFYSTQIHRSWAQLPCNGVTPMEWKQAIETGLKHWCEVIQERDEAREQKSQKERQRVLRGQGSQQPAKKTRLTQGLYGAGPSRSSQTPALLQPEVDESQLPVAGPST